MTKELILKLLAQLDEEILNEIIMIYHKYRPKIKNGMQVHTIPEYVKKRLSFRDTDKELIGILKDFPTYLTPVDAPNKAFAEKCKQIYIDNCFCFDETGELFVHKALEYATSYETKPIIFYGVPGCGKSHRASVFAKMLGIPYERVDIPLAAHSSGLTGEGGSYKNASMGIIANGMYKTKSCNFLLNGEELDKEERVEGRPSFSDQFLKILDQDATRLRDNRLGFDIDASHIVYVFTANEKDKIKGPMLDRCDVIELSPPTQSEIENIVRGAVIPNAIRKINKNSEISFSEEAIEFIINSLWNGTDTSIRQYQNVVSKCVSAANYLSVNEERPVIIGIPEAKIQVGKIALLDSPKNRIGFC